MRVLVCGGRNVGRVSRNVSRHATADIHGGVKQATQERQFVADRMNELHAEKKFTEIIGGMMAALNEFARTGPRLMASP